jgi:hypothetical protein
MQAGGLSTPPSKRSRASATPVDHQMTSTLLGNKTGVVLIVLRHLGPGYWLSVSPVSKLWRRLYAALPDRDRLVISDRGVKQYMRSSSRMTMYKAVLPTLASVQSALNYGLVINAVANRSLQYAAGLYSSLQALKYMASLGTGSLPLGNQVLRGAAASGSLEKVTWLCSDMKMRMTKSIVECAASSGSMELLTWLQRAPMELDAVVTLRCAARAGHQHILHQIIFTGPLEPDETSSVHEAAAEGGQASLLRWLRDEGHSWSKNRDNMLISAARGGSIETLDYLLSFNCLEPADPAVLTQAMNAAGAFDHLSAVQWLRREHRAEWPAVLSYVRLRQTLRWFGPVLQWARDEGCTSPLN